MILVRFFIALALTMIVPAGGYLLSSQILGEVDAGLIAQGIPTVQPLCAMPEAGTDPDLIDFCSEMGRLGLLQTISMVAGLFGIGVPVVFLFASLLAGSNRRRLSLIFPITVHATLVFMTVSVAMQGAILTYGLFVAESYYLNRVHVWLIGLVGFGAAGAAYNLFMQTFSFAAKYENFVHGVAVGEDKAPGLHSFVAGLAEKLGASKPDNIIVGLEPNFFVTSAEVRIPDSPKPLEGETLYVSLPLARLMTVSEFAGIIGHELGHFRGEDTAYSLKFAPVYAGLGNALMATSRQSGEGIGALAKLPAKAMLTFMMDVFAMNERSIGRERELRADEAGAEASSPMALVTSLVKVSLYVQIWGYIQGENLHRLAHGKTTRNLSSLLESRARFDIEHKKMDEIIDIVAESRISHPTDTHPTVSERMKSLAVERSQIDKSQILVPEVSAVML
ncbi:MAG: M48 family metalloprotease, partial [Alphaproteobacteria bacterium]|nr:M48 family metalloprotease [Alphaproteobacteria bacterium]